MNFDLALRVLNFVALLASSAVSAYIYMKGKNDKRFQERIEAEAKIRRELDDERRQRIAQDDVLRNELQEERSARQQDINAVGGRVSILEEWRKHVPSQEDMNDIRESLASHGRALATVEERSDTTLEGVRRIEQFLMERGR